MKRLMVLWPLYELCVLAVFVGIVYAMAHFMQKAG